MRNLQMAYRDDLQEGFHPEATKSYSIITHEQSHALGGFLSKKHLLGSGYSSSEKDSFEFKLRERVLKQLNLTLDDVGKELSTYATKNSYEWFAEAITEAMDSPVPRRMAAEAMRLLDEIIAEEGLK